MLKNITLSLAAAQTLTVEDDLKHGSLGSMEMDEEWLTKFLTKLKA